MENASKKSSLKPKLQKARAKVASTLHGHPAKNLKIIAVTGATGKDIVAHFLHKILLSGNNRATLILSPDHSPLTAMNLHSYLSKSLKSGADYVVIETPASIIKNHVFHDLPIHMAILTDLPATAPDQPSSHDETTLFNAAPDLIVLNRDDPSFDHLSTSAAKTITSYGRHKDAATRINRSKLYKKGTEASIAYGTELLKVATFATGESAIHYLAAAVAVAKLLNISSDTIVDGLADYEPAVAPPAATNTSSDQSAK